MISYKHIILFLIALLSIPAAFAQSEEIKFTYLTPKEGLSSNTVNAIIKDRYGLMWFATEDGLDKYDGTNFTIYRHKVGDTSGLLSNDIRAIYEDKLGNLWIGSTGGALSLYDRKKDSFINFPANQKSSGISHENVRTICSDHFGKVWVGSFSGLDILDPITKKIANLNRSFALPGGLPRIAVNFVFEDSKFRMWVGTPEGLFFYNRATSSFIRFLNATTDSSSISGNFINAVAEDKNGSMWFGTDNGISMLKLNGKSFKNFRHSNNDVTSLSSNYINALSVDASNRLWIGTNEGLNIFDVKTSKSECYLPNNRDNHSLTRKTINCIYIDNTDICWLGAYRGSINKYNKNLNLFNLKQSNVFDEKGLNGSIVTSFAEDKHGNIFIGTDGGPLNLFDKKTGLFTHFNLKPIDNPLALGLPILSLEMAKTNHLFIGTYSNGLFILDPNTGIYKQLRSGKGPSDLNSNDIFAIKEDNEGKIWVGTNGEGIDILDPESQKVIARYCKEPKSINDYKWPINAYIRSFAEDRNKDMWIGSYGGGIAVYHRQNKTFTFFNKNNSNLPNDAIISLLIDSKDQVWVATSTGGLSFLDKKTNLFVNYSEKDGLQNTSICSLIEDRKGNIWMSSAKGINCFDLATKKFSNYSTFNGVLNDNFVNRAGLLSSSGEIYFGGTAGFNYFNPSSFKKNSDVPSVMFTDLKISNNSVAATENGPIKEHISVAKEINLDYKQNFALSFVSINFTSPEQNRYAYKLEGFDKDWINAGTAKTASYTNLDPGKYTFHVRASNNDGTWGTNETSIQINVKPPFWRTVYAYILYVLVILGSLLYIRHMGIQKLKRNFALQQERANAAQKLEQERKQAEQARELDRLKIKFLTNLSHEFRTPISLISGPVDQLLLQEKNGKLFEQLQMIKRNSRRLLNLVNQLLDFRKMEEHELKLQATEGELVAFIKDAADSFKDLSVRKNIAFKFSSTVDAIFTFFDHDKIERIVFNLLSNAFKFTVTGGSIQVEVGQIQKNAEPANTWVTIKVSDTGIGIPLDKQAKIFDRFFQADTGSAILNQGTGIGLSITQEFVKMQGGTINIESEVGKGSTFTVLLPFLLLADKSSPNTGFGTFQKIIGQEDVTTAPKAQANANEPLKDLSTKTEKPKGDLQLDEKSDIPSILLVEDNDDFRFYLKDNLKLHYKVFEASDGNEGWQKALAHHPQLIVSDISMPFMDGIALCQKLKADKRTCHIPIIILTALTGEQEQLNGLGTGASDFITKPFNFEVLGAKIKNLLSLHNTFKNTYTKQIKILPAEVQIESDDEKLLNDIALYLDENLNNYQLSVEDLSKHLGMSRSSLYNKLFKLTGETPVEYIRSFKLDKAAILLEKTDMNIAQIAYSTGFSKPSYFTKSFKEKFNMLPSEYINTVRKTTGIKE